MTNEKNDKEKENKKETEKKNNGIKKTILNVMAIFCIVSALVIVYFNFIA